VSEVILTMSGAQSHPLPEKAAPVPEAAVPEILAAFDKYEEVALPQGHGMQDLDNLIFNLIRTPEFSEKVNDIEDEFGNSLYQQSLDFSKRRAPGTHTSPGARSFSVALYNGFCPLGTLLVRLAESAKAFSK
jgi:hypothetical protein